LCVCVWLSWLCTIMLILELWQELREKRHRNVLCAEEAPKELKLKEEGKVGSVRPELALRLDN